MTNNNELLAHTLDIAARYGVREDSPLALAPYTHSELSGAHVRVDLGVYRFPKRGLKAALVACAKQAGRYAKGMGLLDDAVISRLY